MAGILQLEFGALAAENRADPLCKGSSLLGMCAHCRIACPEVVGPFGVVLRGYSICPGKVSPGFVDGDDGTRLVDNRYVRGEAVQGPLAVLAAPGFLLFGGRSGQLFLVWFRSWGHVKYLLSAVAYLMKAIIQTAAAEGNQGGGDSSPTDLVSGVGTLN